MQIHLLTTALCLFRTKLHRLVRTHTHTHTHSLYLYMYTFKVCIWKNTYVSLNLFVRTSYVSIGTWLSHSTSVPTTGARRSISHDEIDTGIVYGRRRRKTKPGRFANNPETRFSKYAVARHGTDLKSNWYPSRIFIVAEVLLHVSADFLKFPLSFTVETLLYNCSIVRKWYLREYRSLWIEIQKARGVEKGG